MALNVSNSKMAAGSNLSLVTWNVEWRPTHSRQAQVIRERIFAHDPDVICLTESQADFLGGYGHTIESHPDYGYPIKGNRRKALLWSKQPWREVDRLGHPDLPPGRFVGGRTETPIGSVRVLGVCIPWSDAHVTSGRRDQTRWEEHGKFISGLGKILEAMEEPAVLAGDFNQADPRTRAPKAMHEALLAALAPSFRIGTSGVLRPIDRQSIDHIAHTPDLEPSRVTSISEVGPDGQRLSDHFGVACFLSRSRPA